MKKLTQYIRVDKNGFMIEPILLDEEKGRIPSDCVPSRDPDDFRQLYKLKWDFKTKQWVEGATPEEIELINNQAKEQRELTEIEKLQIEIEQLREDKKVAELALLELAEILLG